MSYITDFHNTSLVLSYAADSFSKLKTFQSVSPEFKDVISYNYYGLWNNIFSMKNLEDAAKLGCIDYLKHNIDGDWNQIKPFSALCISLKNGHVKFFRKLWKIYNIEDEIILFIACRYGNTKIARKILEKGEINIDIFANPSYTNNGENLEFSTIRKYLDSPYEENDGLSSADFEDEENDGLSLADFEDDKYFIEVFYWYDITPLQIASRYGNLDLVKYLVETGADINIQTTNEFMENSITAIQLSLSHGEHFHVFEYLHSEGAIVYYPVHHSFASLRARIFYTMLSECPGKNHYSYNKYRTIYEKNRSDAIKFFDFEFKQEAKFNEESSVTENIFFYEDPVIILHYGLVDSYKNFLYDRYETDLDDIYYSFRVEVIKEMSYFKELIKL